MRNDVQAALKASVVPGLRALGFEGTFPHFRRKASDGIELLTFQFESSGSGNFVVEIAKCSLEGISGWGRSIAPSRVNAHHVNRRFRLGAIRPGGDHWFSAEDFERSPGAAAAVLLKLVETQGTSWWASHST
jgi:hypothetical protein